MRDEVLATRPLEEGQVAQIMSYCGITTAAIVAEAEPEEVYEDQTALPQQHSDDAYEDDETVLAGLNYESDDGFLQEDDE